MNECFGYFAVLSRGKDNIPWCTDDGGFGGFGVMKSKRRESIIRRMARLWVATSWQSEQLEKSGKESRVKRNPRVNKYIPAAWMRKTQTRSPKRVDTMNSKAYRACVVFSCHSIWATTWALNEGLMMFFGPAVRDFRLRPRVPIVRPRPRAQKFKFTSSLTSATRTRLHI